MKAFLFILSGIVTHTMCAQLPGFEIYLMNMPDGNEASAPLNISNHTGYDNQPSFTPDGKYILFSSFRDTVQSDIYKYDIETTELKQLTYTIESDYSPEITPDKKHISVVRVEKDSSQRLCLYNTKGKNPELIMDSFRLIGYYGWYDKNNIALFNLPEPFTLVLTDIEGTYPSEINKNIGRCIKKIPGEHAFSYIVKFNDSIWEIRKEKVIEDMVDAKSGFLFGGDHIISQIPPVSEDYAWLPDGSKIYMARGARLFYFDYTGDKQWHASADLSKAGIKKIFRLAISPDGKQMVFVADE